jgi:lysophospholipase L1-like esterase
MRRSLAVLVACAALAVPAAPVGAGGPPEGPIHLALGDSQAFGFGVFPEERLGYVPVLKRWLHGEDCRAGEPAGCPHLELVNMSVSGATSTSMIADQLQPAVDLIRDRNTDSDEGNDVILITLTIGGNDLFNPVVGNCLNGITVTCAEVIASVFETFTSNLGIILGTLRVEAPDAQIVISTYDNPLAACFLAPFEAFGDVVLEGGTIDGFTLPFGFNQIIETVAAATGSDVAEMFGALTVDDWVGGDDCTHPNIRGYHKMAKVFLGVVELG